jgi:hypothetical protein
MHNWEIFMEEKNNWLRGVDFYCGLGIMIFGAFVVVEGFGMPLRDSLGGVQNVWYVSPALSPIFVGVGFFLLGALLSAIGLNEAGAGEIKRVLRTSLAVDTLLSLPVQRFLVAATIPAVYIFVLIPRVDFCIASILFLWLYMMLFFLVETEGFRQLQLFFALGMALLCATLVTAGRFWSESMPYAGDLLTAACTAAFILRARGVVARHGSGAAFWRTLAICITVTIILTVCFRFFLLVPLPTEGTVVEFMDRIRYNEF